jgi:hypothetical protein
LAETSGVLIPNASERPFLNALHAAADPITHPAGDMAVSLYHAVVVNWPTCTGQGEVVVGVDWVVFDHSRLSSSVI